MLFKVLDGITYQLPNFKGCTVEVWQWISNSIPQSIMDVITHPYEGPRYVSLALAWSYDCSSVSETIKKHEPIGRTNLHKKEQCKRFSSLVVILTALYPHDVFLWGLPRYYAPWYLQTRPAGSEGSPSWSPWLDSKLLTSLPFPRTPRARVAIHLFEHLLSCFVALGVNL